MTFACVASCEDLVNAACSDLVARVRRIGLMARCPALAVIEVAGMQQFVQYREEPIQSRKDVRAVLAGPIDSHGAAPARAYLGIA